jgi:hypothetical protein
VNIRSMAQIWAQKQWLLSKQETITSFESWRQNLQYTFSLDSSFAPFLVDGSTWLKKSNAEPLRGFAMTPRVPRKDVEQLNRKYTVGAHAWANCKLLSGNIQKHYSQKLHFCCKHFHFGFQSSGSHFLDLNNIRLEAGERPEDLFQCLNSFVEENLLKADGSIRHHGELPAPVPNSRLIEA